MRKLFDPIRSINVPPLPEEIVRQKMILHLIDLGYPKKCLGVEVALSSLPHLQHRGIEVKNRRIDLICFAKNIHPQYPLYPLLMIECKAEAFSEKVIDQVMGYNHFVNAYYVAIVNENQFLLLWTDPKKKERKTLSYLPSYQELINSINLRGKAL